MANTIKVLIVEDDKMIIEMYTLKFTQEGYEVLNAENGKEGLEMAMKHKPDIILLDIILPKMDGFSVLKELKAMEVTKGIPVVLLTNLGQDGDVRKGLELGAIDYLIKANYTPSQVVEKVKSLI
ncbi:MAG: response regulator [Parcubacteria group bacterium]|nr:response regulator [Parcubacteria group bacterium]